MSDFLRPKLGLSIKYKDKKKLGASPKMVRM